MTANFKLLLCCTVLLTACQKKDHSSAPPGNDRVTTALTALGDAITTLYAYGTDHTVDVKTALVKSADLIKTHTGVSNVTVHDSTCLMLTLTNGMQTILTLDFKNDDGSSITRGGDHYEKFFDVLGAEDRQNVKNSNILFYAPAFPEFYLHDEDKALESIVKNSSAQATFTRAVSRDCKPGTIKQFGQYGLVLMDTHGQTFGFQAGYLAQVPLMRDSLKNGKRVVYADKIRTEEDLKRVIIEANDAETYDLLLQNKMIIDASIKIKKPYADWISQIEYAYNPKENTRLWATTKYLEALPSWDSTIILGNFCYSGKTFDGTRQLDGYKSIRETMLEKKLGAYFCYVTAGGSSVPVSNRDALIAEKSFITSLLVDFDTTGNAHVDNNSDPIKTWQSDVEKGTESTLTLFGQKNIWYGCGGNLTDTRDGNVYKTVCIGGKRWMAENLRYNLSTSAVNGAAPDAKVFGRLYNWNEAMQGAAPSTKVPSGVQGVCPAGWHLPSNGEWMEMMNAVGGQAIAGGAVKTPQYWAQPNTGATNSSGLSMVPGGYYSSVDNNFKELGTYGYYWNTSLHNNLAGTYDFFAIRNNSAVLSQVIYAGDANIKISVRCVKD